MEIVFQVLILFVIVNTALKLSFWKWWQAAIFGLVCAGFTVAISPYTTSQSKTELLRLISSNTVMQDMAVLVTLESAFCIAYCFIALKEIFGKKVKHWGPVLFWYPGLLIFPVLFYIQTQLIFGLPGTDFNTITYVMAGGVFVLLPLVSYGAKYLLPEKDLRLEVFFIVSLFICIIGLVCTADGKVTYAAAEEAFNWKALTLGASLFISMFVIGYLVYKLKWKLKRKTIKN